MRTVIVIIFLVAGLISFRALAHPGVGIVMVERILKNNQRVVY
jgi:hypothetical protein